MIHKIKEIYHAEYMNRPLIYKCYSRVIFSLVLCLAWYRFVNTGEKGIDFAFTAAGVVFLAMAWFFYLKLDGVKVGHLMEGWGKKKRNAHWNKDIADFVDEEVVDYSELQDDEKDVIKFLSNLIVGLLYLLAAAVALLVR